MKDLKEIHCKTHIGDFMPLECKVCDNAVKKGYAYGLTKPKQLKEGWGKRFDKKFGYLQNIIDAYYVDIDKHYGFKKRKEIDDIKAFLSEELANQKKEMIERIEDSKTIDKKSGMCWVCSYYEKDKNWDREEICKCRHNRILDDIIKAIRK